MKKRLLSALLALLLLPALRSTATAVNAPFSDVTPGAWYAREANWCLENGIIGGTGENTFSPNVTMTRAMLAVVLHRMAGKPDAAVHNFTDVPEWCAGAVGWSAEQGYMTGYGNGLFGAGNPVTREQFAAILWRYAGCPAAEADVFTDEAAISDFARPAVAWARAEKVVGGVGENRFDPHGVVTRSQVAVILYRYLNREVPESPITQEGNQMYIHVNGAVLTATLADNSSASALRELLKKGPLTIDMSDYGNFEKVGSLGVALPRNDEHITTSAGDIILYQGNQITIYYAQNTWNFTRLGKINNVTIDELTDILGEGDVSVTLSITPVN